MRFSIIIPVYNVEDYLSECVESILEQTYHNYQIILVDDGSKDGSGALCDEYASKYPDCVETVHKENQGQLLARVCGMHKVEGDIVLFLDSDDCLRRDALELLKNTFEKTDCDLILFNASVAADFQLPFRDYRQLPQTVIDCHTKTQVYELLVTTSLLNNVCLKAVKRSLMPLEMDFTPFASVKTAEDLLLCIPIISKAEKLFLLDENLYYYRQRQSSITHVFDKGRMESIKAVHSFLEKYIDMWGMQALKPKHNARKVKGWVDTLWFFLSSNQKAGNISYKDLAGAMAEDAYFRDAFQNMDRGSVTSSEYTIAWLLYHRRLQAARVACYMSKIINKAKRILQPG